MDTIIKPATKIDVKATLLQLEPGETTLIKTNLIKASSIRSAVRILRKEGYQFEASEKGLIDEVKVTRYN